MAEPVFTSEFMKHIGVKSRPAEMPVAMLANAYIEEAAKFDPEISRLHGHADFAESQGQEESVRREAARALDGALAKFEGSPQGQKFKAHIQQAKDGKFKAFLASEEFKAYVEAVKSRQPSLAKSIEEGAAKHLKEAEETAIAVVEKAKDWTRNQKIGAGVAAAALVGGGIGWAMKHKENKEKTASAAPTLKS